MSRGRWWLCAAWLALGLAPATALTASPPPVELTAEQDQQRMLDLLQINALRRGPDGDPTSAHAANFDESKVAPYALPDPLRFNDGKRVRTRADWQQRRREIVEYFDREIYGRVPRDVPSVSWKLTSSTRETQADVAVISKQIVGRLDNAAYPLIDVQMQLNLTVPANAHGPVPVMLEFGLSPEALAGLKQRFTEAQWAAFMGPGPDWRRLLLAKGWGYATLIPTTVQADNGAGLTHGVIGLTNHGQPRKLDDWGALRAWAWGASRALDYFETDPAVDAHQVGIEGLSRYGKAALVAMAYEPRFAIAFVGSSGAGGAKILRRNFGEQVENIASSAEYHWMAGNFLKYAGPLTANDLPVDSHQLIALCAPRPVFISSGSQQVEGGWVDAQGMFLGAVAAGPVYELLGKKSLGTSEFPPMETALIDGDIGFRQHRYGHTTGPNWPTFLSFATRYLVSEPSAPPPAHAAELGVFEGQSDVGSVTPPGTAHYDSAQGIYRLSSAGANTWYHIDDFHYVWKKVSGDLALTADVVFPPHSYDHEPDPHRKGIVMFRQTLDAGGVYAGVGVHGSGMTALQYRRQRGANAQDIELNIDAPGTVRLEKRGDDFTLYLSMKGEPPHQVGATVRLHLKAPFYVGLGAVSHDVDTTDRVEFSHVALQPPAPAAAAGRVLYSTLQTLQTEDQFRRAMVIRSAAGPMQSANWMPDGKNIYVHANGHVVRIPLLNPPAGGAPQDIDTQGLQGCSANYGLSGDGQWLAMSCPESAGGPHQIYLLPAEGGAARAKLTHDAAPSFFHAWSPDSRTIAFTRGSASKADIFTIDAQGGTVLQLTHDAVNDGPDYSPDGRFIYFDSARSGTLQIWRMKPDGSAPEQLTDDEQLNSSPHVAPDGKSLAFLSQPAGSAGGIGATALRIMLFNDGLIRTLADFQGDRGSLSMYSWGDANHLAFISYQMLPAHPP